MVLSYWGVDVDQDELAEELGVSKSGTDLGEMVDPFRDRGFKTETGGYITEFEKAKKKLLGKIDQDKPVIIEIKWDKRNTIRHFVVIVGYTDDYVYVNDPAGKDHETWSYSLLKERWSFNRYWMLIAYK